MEFDLEDPFSGLCMPRGEEEALAAPHEVESVEKKRDIDGSISDLFSAESDHMSSACENLTFHISLRQQAASLIHQAQVSCNSDPFVVYLAVNYLDRFLSRQEMPMEKPWMVRLLSVACLSLASKMRKTRRRFCIADFQGNDRFIFDARTIRRMELLVLGALGWRMRSITPFSFLEFFLSFFRPNRRPLLSALKSRATEIIFKAQTEMKLLAYKPSVVAAAALLCATNELYPNQFPAFWSSILTCSCVDKEELSQSHAVMGHTLTGTGGGCHPSLSSSCGTPVTVLDQHHRHCSSSESENNAAGSEVIGNATEKEDWI